MGIMAAHPGLPALLYTFHKATIINTEIAKEISDDPIITLKILIFPTLEAFRFLPAVFGQVSGTPYSRTKFIKNY